MILADGLKLKSAETKEVMTRLSELEEALTEILTPKMFQAMVKDHFGQSGLDRKLDDFSLKGISRGEFDREKMTVHFFANADDDRCDDAVKIYARLGFRARKKDVSTPEYKAYQIIVDIA